MRRVVVFTFEANRDIKDIFDYIGEFGSLGAAERFASGIRAFCMTLADFPERGINRADGGLGLKIVPFRQQATIAYSITDSSVVIQRVLYRGRDIGKALGEED